MNTIIYEQPTNELIRTALRFEHLLQQLTFHVETEHFRHTRIALEALLEIINILDRPDLRTLLIKEFMRHQHLLEPLLENSRIDEKKLAVILLKIDNILEGLNKTTGRFAQELREMEFLTTIRLHLLNPGGASAFENPAYHYWLQQPYALRLEYINFWLKQMEFIKETLVTLLQLVRDSYEPEAKIAPQGYYQLNLDPKKNPCQLVRVILPAKMQAFPEISAGSHRVCIRFLTTNFTDRMKPLTEDVHFKLSCCIAQHDRD